MLNQRIVESKDCLIKGVLDQRIVEGLLRRPSGGHGFGEVARGSGGCQGTKGPGGFQEGRGPGGGQEVGAGR